MMSTRQRTGMLATVLMLTAALWAVNLVWLRKDTRPPVWDMALHQTYALNYLPGQAEGIPWAERSGNYPPFVHWMIALCYLLFHPGPHVAVMANIPATLILLGAVYLLGFDLAGAAAARWACILTALVPYMIWMSRETVLDYWLAAWLAAALAVLLRSDGFRLRYHSILFGCIFALGLLTKWFFAGFLFFPILYIFVRNRIWRDPVRRTHCADALLAAFAGAAVWYLPNTAKLTTYFFENAQVGALEGEPPVLSFQSLIYYLRLLEGYQLFGLLFLLVVIALVFVWRRGLLRDAGFLAAAVCGGWLVLTLLRTKDPRFSMPLLGPLCVVAGAWLQSWKTGRRTALLKSGLVLLLCFQAFAANFGVRWIPQEVVLLRGYSGSLRWDWNLYLQHYFHVLGPPRREDWKIEPILRRVAADAGAAGRRAELALIPDLPHFNSTTFSLLARLRSVSVRVAHLRSQGRDVRAFGDFQYVVMTERDQGMSWTTGSSLRLNQIIVDDPRTVRLLETFALPDGNRARLYSIERGAPARPAYAFSGWCAPRRAPA